MENINEDNTIITMNDLLYAGFKLISDHTGLILVRDKIERLNLFTTKIPENLIGINFKYSIFNHYWISEKIDKNFFKCIDKFKKEIVEGEERLKVCLTEKKKSYFGEKSLYSSVPYYDSMRIKTNKWNEKVKAINDILTSADPDEIANILPEDIEEEHLESKPIKFFYTDLSQENLFNLNITDSLDKITDFCINIVYEIKNFKKESKIVYSLEFSEEMLLPAIKKLEQITKKEINKEEEITLLNGFKVKINKKLKGNQFILIS